MSLVAYSVQQNGKHLNTCIHPIHLELLNVRMFMDYSHNVSRVHTAVIWNSSVVKLQCFYHQLYFSPENVISNYNWYSCHDKIVLNTRKKNAMCIIISSLLVDWTTHLEQKIDHTDIRNTTQFTFLVSFFIYIIVTFFYIYNSDNLLVSIAKLRIM